MNVEKIQVDMKAARELYREYKAHKHYSDAMDRWIQRTYQLIAQGRVVIKAMESVRVAGLDEQGYPKLAIANAVQKMCHLEMWTDGSARMAHQRWPNHRDRRNSIVFPRGTFPERKQHVNDAQAIVPIIPVYLRPKEAVANYHILFEAEWRRVIPRDPYLLRRIGGDLWLVVAAWELTEVERSAMATRLTS